MAKNRQVGGTRSTPAATPSRLPSTRERRPALAALAVVLIVGGAAASGWLALRAGDRVEYLQVSQEVVQGQEISADDLEEVRLPRGFDDGVPASQRGDVEGLFASTRLLPGTVLSPGMVTEGGGVAEGTVQVPIGVPPAVAGNLSSGASVALSIEGADGGDGQIVVGEVVRAPDLGNDGSISSGQSDVTVLVSVGGQCLDAVAAGLRDNSVQLALVGDVDGAGLGSACRR